MHKCMNCQEDMFVGNELRPFAGFGRAGTLQATAKVA